MSWFAPPYEAQYERETCVSMPGLFAPEECDRIIGIHRHTTPAAGSVGGQDIAAGERVVNTGVRRSHLWWLAQNPDHAWIYGRIAQVVNDANNRFFGFHLSGFLEDMQLARYDQADAGGYGWHCDFRTRSVHRKLSATIQLSDETTYQGGDLEIMYEMPALSMPRGRGSITIFPSFALHRVAPVTAGTRWSLVAWVHGPRFV